MLVPVRARSATTVSRVCGRLPSCRRAVFPRRQPKKNVMYSRLRTVRQHVAFCLFCFTPSFDTCVRVVVSFDPSSSSPPPTHVPCE